MPHDAIDVNESSKITHNDYVNVQIACSYKTTSIQEIRINRSIETDYFCLKLCSSQNAYMANLQTVFNLYTGIEMAFLKAPYHVGLLRVPDSSVVFDIAHIILLRKGLRR